MAVSKLCWAIVRNGSPIPFYARFRKKDSIKAFNENLLDKSMSLKDFKNYKATKCRLTIE